MICQIAGFCVAAGSASSTRAMLSAGVGVMFFGVIHPLYITSWFDMELLSPCSSSSWDNLG